MKTLKELVEEQAAAARKERENDPDKNVPHYYNAKKERRAQGLCDVCEKPAEKDGLCKDCEDALAADNFREDWGDGY